MVPGSSIKTVVAPSGAAGALAGKAALAHVAISGGEVRSMLLEATHESVPVAVRVRRTSAIATDTAAFGARLHRLRLAQKDTVVDGLRLLFDGRVVVIESEETELDVLLNAPELERLVERRVPGLHGARVTIGQGVLAISGESQMPRGSLTAYASLDRRGANELILASPRVWLDGTEMTSPAAALMVGALNPVFSVRDAFPNSVGAEIREVIVGEGIVRLRVQIPRQGKVGARQ
jgi:hypothetical protein